MKKCCALLLSLCLLTGCTPLLEREYSTVEPHSSKFWESEAAGTLRAENYQDIVNDLLILIGQHTESATLRLYNVENKLQAADLLERATVEVQQETPMGAYAVEYITSASQEQRGYYEVELQIGYRRTLEQIQAVVNATSPEALYTLLDTALSEGRTELAVRVGYWNQESGQAQVEAALTRVREERGLTERPMWPVLYYPEGGPVGLIEFLLDQEVPPEETEPADGQAEITDSQGESVDGGEREAEEPSENEENLGPEG